MLERQDVQHVTVPYDVREKDFHDVKISTDKGIKGARRSVTYQEIREWIFENYGLNVSSLYIAQMKDRRHLAKESSRTKEDRINAQPVMPAIKAEAILNAFVHFGLEPAQAAAYAEE